MKDMALMRLPQLHEEREKTERALRQALASLECLRNQRPLPGHPPAPTGKAERKVKRLRDDLRALNEQIEWRARNG